jgi:hypothetical protein
LCTHPQPIMSMVQPLPCLLPPFMCTPCLPAALSTPPYRSALARWFSLGLLQLQRITWESSPGQLLQRVQATEAVHRMQHLEQLQRRLQQSDRRVYAFMHPSLPGMRTPSNVWMCCCSADLGRGPCRGHLLYSPPGACRSVAVEHRCLEMCCWPTRITSWTSNSLV